jgi:hypothetical protein
VRLGAVEGAPYLEFLKVIYFTLPEWAKTDMNEVAKALDDSYAEPAKDAGG